MMFEIPIVWPSGSHQMLFIVPVICREPDDFVMLCKPSSSILELYLQSQADSIDGVHDLTVRII
jgi:hypothetical protein